MICTRNGLRISIFLYLSASALAHSAEAPSPESIIVQTYHAKFHIKIVGHGPTIVMLPSLGRGAEDFNDLAGRLAGAGFRVVLPQPRGIGGSTGTLEGLTLHNFARDIADVIDACGGAPVTVLGHAFGNRVARTLAADHPKLVKQVVLLAAGGTIPPSDETMAAFKKCFDESLPAPERLAAIQQAFFAKGNDAKVWQEGWNPKVAEAQSKAGKATPNEDWWGGGSAPILVLQASDDMIALPENSALLAKQFPTRVMVVEIPHSGHAMLPEQPALIADTITKHLRAK